MIFFSLAQCGAEFRTARKITLCGGPNLCQIQFWGGRRGASEDFPLYCQKQAGFFGRFGLCQTAAG